jgi:hypothetical protein
MPTRNYKPVTRPTTRQVAKLIRAAKAEAFSAGSRTTLDQIYSGCEDEAVVLYISSLLNPNRKAVATSAATEAIRAKAVARAHEFADKRGLSFAKGMKVSP